MINSAEEFVQLRTSEDPACYDRATKEEASTATWRDVIELYPEMRRWVAHNKKLPNEIIEILARDCSPDVRGVIARKRKTPPSLLLQMAMDKDENVRLAVACNPKSSKDVLNVLIRDKWDEVRVAAERRLKA